MCVLRLLSARRLSWGLVLSCSSLGCIPFCFNVALTYINTPPRRTGSARLLVIKDACRRLSLSHPTTAAVFPLHSRSGMQTPLRNVCRFDASLRRGRVQTGGAAACTRLRLDLWRLAGRRDGTGLMGAYVKLHCIEIIILAARAHQSVGVTERLSRTPDMY